MMVKSFEEEALRATEAAAPKAASDAAPKTNLRATQEARENRIVQAERHSEGPSVREAKALAKEREYGANTQSKSAPIINVDRPSSGKVHDGPILRTPRGDEAVPRHELTRERFEERRMNQAKELAQIYAGPIGLSAAFVVGARIDALKVGELTVGQIVDVTVKARVFAREFFGRDQNESEKKGSR